MDFSSGEQENQLLAKQPFPLCPENQFSGLIEGYQEKHVSSEHPNVAKDG